MFQLPWFPHFPRGRGPHPDVIGKAVHFIQIQLPNQELSVLPHLQTEHMVTHGVLSPFWLVSNMVPAHRPCTSNYSVCLPSVYPQGCVMAVPENQSSQASFGCDLQGRKQIVSFPQDEIKELLLPERFAV